MKHPLLWLAFVVSLVYLPSLFGGLVYEDLNGGTEPVTGTWRGWQKELGRPTQPGLDHHSIRYVVAVAMETVRRPRLLTYWSFRFTAFLTTSVWIFHLENLAIHLLNGWLLWQLLVLIGATGPWPVVALGVFWLHPLQVESVAYLSGRFELLAVCFLLLTMLNAFVARPSSRSIAVTALCGLLALASKESASVGIIVALPLAVWAWSLDRASRRWVVPVGTWLALGLLYWWRLSTTPELGHWPWGEFVGRQSIAVWRYLALLVVPVGFTIHHNFEVVIRPIVNVAWAWLLLACIWLWTQRTEHRLFVGACTWMVALLSARILIPQASLLPEHAFYGPMIGVSLSLGLWHVADRDHLTGSHV